MAIYLGTATPSAYYLGATTVSKLYLGTTQVWPEVSAAPAFFGPNSVWTAVSFSGTGVLNDKYFKASISGTADGMWIRATAAGTVFITADSVTTDDIFKISKSANSTSWTDAFSAGSSDGYSQSAFSLSFAVAAGDYIQIARPFDPFGFSIVPYAQFTNLRVWWTA